MRHCARLRPSLLAVAGKQPLVVDLSGVNRMDTAGLANLVEAYGQAQQCGQPLKLAAVPDTLLKMLHLTNLDQIFPIAPTIEAALAR